MAKCDWCGNEFNRRDAKNDFCSEYTFLPLSYDSFQKCLCGSCAIDAIEKSVEGVYFETCEVCGTTFDYIVESQEFDVEYGDDHACYLIDWWKTGPICCKCAIKAAEDND